MPCCCVNSLINEQKFHCTPFLLDTVQPGGEFGGLPVILHLPPFWNVSLHHGLLCVSLRVHPGTCRSQLSHYGRESDGLLLGDWCLYHGAPGLPHPGLANFASRGKLSASSLSSVVDVC